MQELRIYFLRELSRECCKTGIARPLLYYTEGVTYLKRFLTDLAGLVVAAIVIVALIMLYVYYLDLLFGGLIR